MPEPKLKEKAVVGAVWTTIQRLGIVVLQFVSTIILARLLTADDYGIIGMLAIFIAVSNTFIDGGFGSALLQKKNPTNVDYSTIFYWNIFLSLMLYGLLFLCAPLIASFYEMPLLVSVLRVQGLILIINALRLVQTNQLRKQLKFKRVAIVEISVAMVSLSITIFLAGKGWGVWALVAQQLMYSGVTTMLYWIISSWRPLWVFSKDSFKEMFHFGGFVLLSNLINTFCNNIQELMIGKLYKSSTLGYYSKARSTEQIASTLIAYTVDQVSYPVLAEAQNDLAKMRAIIKQFVGVTAFLTFPCMMLLVLLAQPVFLLLYSDRWLTSVPYFQVLCFAGIFTSLQGINYFAVAALGKSKALFKGTLVKRSLGLVSVILGLVFWGMKGLLLGVVLSALITYFVNAILVSRYVGYTLLGQCRDLLPVAMITAFSFLGGFLVGLWNGPYYLVALSQGICFVAVYLFLSRIFHLQSQQYAKGVLKVLLNKFTRKPLRS